MGSDSARGDRCAAGADQTPVDAGEPGRVHPPAGQFEAAANPPEDLPANIDAVMLADRSPPMNSVLFLQSARASMTA